MKTFKLWLPLFTALVFATFVSGSVARASETWSSTGSMSTDRAWHTATLLADGRVLVVGGGYFYSSMTAEIYDPVIGTWNPTSGMSIERSFHTATLLTDGRVLVTGGSFTAEIYDPATGAWSITGSMNTVRAYSHTATRLADGRVLVAGGGGSLGVGFLSSAEVYDPATETWSPTDSMRISRYGHTATLLPDGRVLVAGGGTGSVQSPSAEVYDPATGTWSPTGSMGSSFYIRDHTATQLTDGRVLVVSEARAEVYDSATGAWSDAGTLNVARYGHTATLLVDGRMLVTGGLGPFDYEDVSHSITAAEVYDPATGTWSTTGSMITGRYDHTATLLNDGRVLVAGGVTVFYFCCEWNFTLTAELYTHAEQYTLTATPSTATAGEAITVNWNAPAGHPATDWIGLYSVGDPDTSLIAWQYTEGAAAGSMTFTAPQPAGQYEFRCFTNDTFTRVATSNQVTVNSATYTLTASPDTVAAWSPIIVTWSAPGEHSAADWVGLYLVGAPDTSFISRQDTGGASSGSMIFTVGCNDFYEGYCEYEFRYFTNNTYTKVMTSNTVTVQCEFC